MKGLHKAQFEPRLIRHHVHAPRRLPDQFYINLLHAGQRLNRFGKPARHFTRNRAARRGEGHDHADLVLVVDLKRVNEAEVVDIDRDFRVIDRAASLDHLIVKRVVCAGGRDQRAPSSGGFCSLMLFLVVKT